MQEISKELFKIYAEKEKQRIELLEHCELPKWSSWTIDWYQLKSIEQSLNKRKWKQLEIYDQLLKNRSNPAVYCLSVNKGDGLSLFSKFQEAKKLHSATRIKSGLGAAGFKNLSYLEKEYNGSTCVYVGSRKNDLHIRFKQHLGYGSGRTGALHLAKLYSELEHLPLIDFHYIILHEKYRSVTEKIEAVIQKQLKPFVGKNLLGD